MDTAVPTTVERSSIRKICTRLVPFVALMFFINYLDRTAISFAGPNGMNADLALSALPNFWTIPSRFLTGAAAAAGIALINTFGNVAGFAAGYVTGWLKDASGSYVLPMFVVGGLMLVSAVLMVVLARRGEIAGSEPADAQYAH